MKQKILKLIPFVVIISILISSVTATGLSMQLKRTNPGIAGQKEAELIFDVVNTDFLHKIDGFILCRSPDDTVVSSSLGAATGSGAQYVSPLFTMDTGPYQRSMSLILASDTPGDKITGCTFKYIPYKESITGESSVTEEIKFKGTIDTLGTSIQGFVVTLLEFTDPVNETAKVKLDVDGIPKVVEVGSTENIGALIITVNEATEEYADVDITGIKTILSGGVSTKLYQKMNGKYISNVQDMDYRELRIDKTIPFVEKMSEPECPKAKTSCKAEEVIDVGGFQIKLWHIIAGILALVLLTAYTLGKASKN